MSTTMQVYVVIPNNDRQGAHTGSAV